MKYFLLQLGCQMNLSDSQRIRTVLEATGYTPTENEEEADLLGVVACSVRQKAIDKVYSRIHKWNQWKDRKNLLTFVSGCVLPADREKFLKRFDLLFTINELPHLPDMIRQYGVVTSAGLQISDRHPPTPEAVSTTTDPVESATEAVVTPPPAAIRTIQIGRIRRGPAAPEISGAETTTEGPEDSARDYWNITPTYSSTFEAYVPIQNGCDKFCTFCAVPYTRGREVSRPSTEILAEVTRLVTAGYRSITLLGQNVNSYGLDRRSTEIGFAELLRRIGRLGRQSENPFWLYFTSPHPHDMTDEVIDVIAEYPCLARQIHLPMQSGDDKVLIRMNRNYRIDGYRRVVEKIRQTIPEATLFTDIIVGFTGETEEQFQNTVAAMREFQFNMAYVAMYSPRPGAASSRWADDVPHEQKRHRLQVLSQELHLSSGAYNRALVGRTLCALVDGVDRKPGYFSARTEGKLIVRFAHPQARSATDQVTHRAANGEATRATGNPVIGALMDVRITEAATLSLSGEMVGKPIGAPEPVGAGT